MNQKIRKVFTIWRVILLLAALLFAVIAINPSLAEGVAIRGVVRNSSAADAGILSPKPTAPPMSRERIIAVDSIPIKDVKGYHDYVSKLEPGQPVVVYTSKSTYRLVTKPLTRLVVYNETVNATVEEVVAFNESVNNTVVEQNRTVNRTIEVPRTETVTIGTEDIDRKSVV